VAARVYVLLQLQNPKKMKMIDSTINPPPATPSPATTVLITGSAVAKVIGSYRFPLFPRSFDTHFWFLYFDKLYGAINFAAGADGRPFRTSAVSGRKTGSPRQVWNCGSKRSHSTFHGDQGPLGPRIQSTAVNRRRPLHARHRLQL